tara:strand:+ start:4502 stop:6553 length:2052 start_codon:yes stop_codon:yes gene_type:complete
MNDSEPEACDLGKNSQKVTHCLDPYVATHDNVITPEECNHFIEISKKTLTRALVSNDKKGYVSTGRTGMNTWLRHDHDEITKAVGERIANLVGMPLQNAEQFQVIYYGVSQEYRQHYDSWEHNGSEKTLRCMKYGGARLATALCYLNDVSKGGGTKMTKLNVEIEAKQGKLLIFHNTVGKTNEKHILSEHAGMPVLEGEKYAFNLWFKECPTNILYADFNPDYYKNIPVSTNVLETNNEYNGKPTILYKERHMFHHKGLLNIKEITNMIALCKFSQGGRRRNGWLKITELPYLVSNLEKILDISSKYYENINITEYKPNEVHGKHFTAFDTKTCSRDCFKKLGQRMITITIFLSNHFEIKFPNININQGFSQGDCLIYNNTVSETSERDENLERAFRNNGSMNGYIANLYIREKDVDGNTYLASNIKEEKIVELENYSDTLNEVLMKFSNNQSISRNCANKSFCYNFKGDIDSFKQTIKKYNDIRVNTTNKKGINEKVMLDNYDIDEDFFLVTVNDVLDANILNLCKAYYKETISNNVWELGDRQAHRYKAHNEPMSRFLHYEILPLIEKLAGKPLKPTYTYLSAYVKGADLPGHTDRADCEYTVSFIIDKPDNCEWPIYVHKKRQPEKYKGRYPENPPKEECVPVDCNAGGLMMFQGTDRIHFREKFDQDYYNIILLHYCAL